MNRLQIIDFNQNALHPQSDCLVDAGCISVRLQIDLMCVCVFSPG